MSRNTVIGQTGSVVLADYIKYKTGDKLTVHFQYTKIGPRIMAWVCGPFHSRTYGACAFASGNGARAKAKKRLSDHLARSCNYFGHLMFSDVDGSDTVGEVDNRLLDEGTRNRPIRLRQV